MQSIQTYESGCVRINTQEAFRKAGVVAVDPRARLFYCDYPCRNTALLAVLTTRTFCPPSAAGADAPASCFSSSSTCSALATSAVMALVPDISTSSSSSSSRVHELLPPDVIVNLVPQREVLDTPLASYQDKLLPGIRVLHFPLRKSGIPTHHDHFCRAVAAVRHAAFHEECRVFVHCNKTLRRSWMLLAFAVAPVVPSFSLPAIVQLLGRLLLPHPEGATEHELHNCFPSKLQPFVSFMSKYVRMYDGWPRAVLFHTCTCGVRSDHACAQASCTYIAADADCGMCEATAIVRNERGLLHRFGDPQQTPLSSVATAHEGMMQCCLNCRFSAQALGHSSRVADTISSVAAPLDQVPAAGTTSSSTSSSASAAPTMAPDALQPAATSSASSSERVSAVAPADFSPSSAQPLSFPTLSSSTVRVDNVQACQSSVSPMSTMPPSQRLD